MNDFQELKRQVARIFHDLGNLSPRQIKETIAEDGKIPEHLSTKHALSAFVGKQLGVSFAMEPLKDALFHANISLMAPPDTFSYRACLPPSIRDFLSLESKQARPRLRTEGELIHVVQALAYLKGRNPEKYFVQVVREALRSDYDPRALERAKADLQRLGIYPDAVEQYFTDDKTEE